MIPIAEDMVQRLDVYSPFPGMAVRPSLPTFFFLSFFGNDPIDFNTATSAEYACFMKARSTRWLSLLSLFSVPPRCRRLAAERLGGNAGAVYAQTDLSLRTPVRLCPTRRAQGWREDECYPRPVFLTRSPKPVSGFRVFVCVFSARAVCACVRRARILFGFSVGYRAFRAVWLAT